MVPSASVSVGGCHRFHQDRSLRRRSDQGPGLGHTIAIEITVTGIDETVSIGVDLAGVERHWSHNLHLGMIDVTVVGDSVIVEIIIASVDQAI